MASIVWSQDTEIDPWLDVQENEIWTAPAIVATVVADENENSVPTVVGYQYSISPGPLIGLSVSNTPAGVVLSAPNTLIGSFPAIDIEYQINGVTGHCLTFNEIPAEADEMIRYVPSPINEKQWTIRVTALLSEGGPASASYVINVRANYDTGRDALIGAVNARR